jgi:hypothetical protein
MSSLSGTDGRFRPPTRKVAATLAKDPVPAIPRRGAQVLDEKAA